jgi:8-oxo-dGDP phosphatase
MTSGNGQREENTNQDGSVWEQKARDQDAQESASPWQTYESRDVYHNPWLHVVEYSVLRPDGKPGIYGVVYPGDNAAIVALDEQERVYLVGEFLYPLQRYEWMIPSGKVEAGEDPLTSAKRELAEEVGLRAEHWESLGAYYLSSGISPQTSHIFLARGLQVGSPKPEGTERLHIQLQSLDQVFDACLSNQVRDAPTVLGIWRAWMYRSGP